MIPHTASRALLSARSAFRRRGRLALCLAQVRASRARGARDRFRGPAHAGPASPLATTRCAADRRWRYRNATQAIVNLRDYRMDFFGDAAITPTEQSIKTIPAVPAG